MLNLLIIENSYVFKCSSSCGDGTRYREVYCKDDQTSQRLSAHMCHKDEIPKVEEKCLDTKCNSIDNDVDPTQGYGYNVDQPSGDISIEKVSC